MELEIDEWLSFRDEYLDEAKPWECTYCHRTDMIRIYDTVRAPANLVTLDHITPLSKGGDRYDPENICISCRKCNENKADKEE